MPTRSIKWNDYLSKQLKDKNFTREFILAGLEEGDDLQETLGYVIRVYGVKEYAALVKMDEPSIQRAVNPKHNPTKKTLQKLLDPFGLELGVKIKKRAA